jgi:hypothetical protein
MVVHKSSGFRSPAPWNALRSLCGLLYFNEGLTSEDWSKVTCKNCMRVAAGEKEIVERHRRDCESARNLKDQCGERKG